MDGVLRAFRLCQRRICCQVSILVLMDGVLREVEPGRDFPNGSKFQSLF